VQSGENIWGVKMDFYGGDIVLMKGLSERGGEPRLKTRQAVGNFKRETRGGSRLLSLWEGRLGLV